MKRKSIIALLMVVLLFSLFIFLLFPHKVEHAIVIESNANTTKVYINGKTKKIKTNGTIYSKFTLLNYYYNSIKYFKFEKVSEISERIMTKEEKKYGLEKSGDISLASSVKYYIIDAKNNIKSTSSSNIIVGKNNIKCFKDKSGKLKTFLIFPISYTNMRVVLTNTDFSSIYHNNITLKCKNPSELSSIKDNYKVSIPSGTTINAVKNKNSVTLSFNGTTKTFSGRVYLTGAEISLESIQRGAPLSFYPDYDGTLEITCSSNGLVLINELDLEKYLKKVVPSEMPSYSGSEALKCQAVAARTYAISDMLKSRYAEIGAYVDDSTSSQVYNNTYAQTSTNKAVDETEGLLLLYKGSPIDAKYYSSSSGFGVGYQDIWKTADGKSYDLPYLRIVSFLNKSEKIPSSEKEWLAFYKNTKVNAIDDSSPYFRWNLTYSKIGLEKCLNKSLKSISKYKADYMHIVVNKKTTILPSELKNLKNIKVNERTNGGNITTITFEFENATVKLNGDSNIRNALRCSEAYTGEKNAIELNNGKSSSFLSIPSSFFSVEEYNGNFVFYGGGFGHGVGMSQYGAMALADENVKYTDILKIYYKNVDIKSVSSLKAASN